MAQAMPLRRLKRAFLLTLMRVVVGNKANANHFAYVGEGSARELCRRIVDAGHQSLLIVTDGPLRELGLVDQAIAGLADSGIALHWYDGVEPDPTYEHVRAGAAIMNDNACTAVLAVGGGSSIDAAKIIAAARYSSQNPQQWVGRGKAPETIAALFAIPTTSGTGSEATMGAVITDPLTHQKEVIAGLSLLPLAVAIDPTLMRGMPKPITAATGIDALTHGIEAFIGVFERGTRSEMGRLAVQGVFRWLREAIADPSNVEARMGMAIAAYNGGVAINQVNVGTVHAVAHNLGARYGIPHGVANALVLPHMLATYGASATDKLAELAVATGVSSAPSPAARAEAFIAAVRALIADVGIAATDERLQREDFDAIAEAALLEADGYPSPRLLEKSEFITILRAISAD
jgi:alcohol dehydrogenase class IV